MKKILNMVMAAALIFGLASCSKEIGNEVDQTTDAAVSFTFEKPQGSYVTTYADIATANEWFIKALDMYAATGGTVSKLVANTDYTVTEGAKSYTISMKSDWLLANTGNTVNFYFVGNDATSVAGANTALNATTEATFKNALTNEIALTSGKAGLIQANGNDKNLLFSAVIEDVKIVGKVQKNGTLKRREARFDIVNTIPATFDIEKVYVSNASRNGLIFPTADVVTPAITKASHVDIAGPSTYVQENGENIAKSVFYLYPTDLSAGNTSITIEATTNGTTSLYEVASDIAIEANKRYKIILEAATLTFTLVVADYDEGDDLPVKPVTAPGLIGFSSTGTGLLTNNSYQLIAGENATLTVTLGALSAQGFDVAVSGDAGIVNAGTLAGSMAVGPITYSSAYYPVTFTIPTTYAVSEPVKDVFITFTDKANPKNVAAVLLYDGVGTPEAESNSYLVAPGSDRIYIPISQAYKFWNNNTNFTNAEDLATDALFTADFLWTDVAAGMGAGGAVKNIFAKGQGQDAVLVVEPGTAEGNAVVAVKVGNEIKWSWHIWSLTDAATVEAGAGTDNKWMDRNLGALSITPGDPKTMGFHYQWGRKDPFPGGKEFTSPNNVITKDIFDANGTIISIPSIESGQVSLSKALMNPSHFYAHDTNWTNENTQTTYMWNDPNASASGVKSIFDPCPSGWILPSFVGDNKLSDTGWEEYSSFGRINSSLGGYYPACSRRDVLGLLDRAIGIFGYYQVESPYREDLGRNLVFYHDDRGAQYTSTSRSNGMSVRCVKQ